MKLVKQEVGEKSTVKIEFSVEKEVFDTEYGVRGMVEERQKAYRDTYTRGNIIGVLLCILSPVPLFFSMIGDSEALMSMMVASIFPIAAIGVASFILVGVKWASFQKLLQEGEYNKSQKPVTRTQKLISSIYWPVALAIYLGWSFVSGAWGISWIVWPIAGVLYGAVMSFCGGIDEEEQ